MSNCPRCNSPDPDLHPAVQFEGEVQVCYHPYHGATLSMAELRDSLNELEELRTENEVARREAVAQASIISQLRRRIAELMDEARGA